MDIKDNGAILSAIELAPGQYVTTLAISEIVELVNSGHLVCRFDTKAGHWKEKNAREIALLISEGDYYYDTVSFVVVKGEGAVLFSDGVLQITGPIYVVDGERRVRSCLSLSIVNSDVKILSSRFAATIYYIDASDLERMVEQFEHGTKRPIQKDILKRSYKSSLDIAEMVNLHHDADPLYAGKITTKTDAVLYQDVVVGCISKFFPEEDRDQCRFHDLIDYLVRFLNIAVEFYRADFADPDASIMSGRFITNIYGTCLLMIFASWVLPIYRNNVVKWIDVVNTGLKQMNVNDKELSSVSGRRLNTRIVDSRVQSIVKDALKIGESDYGTEYYENVKIEIDSDENLSDDRKQYRLLVIRGMLNALSKAEESHGAKIVGGDDDRSILIINDMMSDFSQSYAHIVEVELRSYMAWLEANKGVRFSDNVMRACASWQINSANMRRSYFASIDDLRDTINKLIPVRDVVTQRDYDRIIVQLIFFGFTIDEAVALPADSMSGKIIKAYGKEIEIDDELRIMILRYRMEDTRYSDNDDVKYRRSYKIDHNIALVSLNTSSSKYTVRNCRTRIIEYSNNDRELNCHDIWISGVFSRMVNNGTTIDPVTHTVIGKYNRSNFELYKQTISEK